jgi:hypothetical protein
MKRTRTLKRKSHKLMRKIHKSYV